MEVSNFLLNILASIIGASIFLFFSIKISKQLKWLFTGILSRVVDSDLEYVYQNKKEFQGELKEELKRAKFVYLLASKGSELQRDTFAPILNETSKYSKKDVKILLPDIKVSESIYDWTTKNDNDIAEFDNAYGNGFLKEQISTNLKFLDKYIRVNQVEVNLYNLPHMGRIIITDKFCFYTPYGNVKQSSHSKVYKFRSPGEMYENYKRFFELVWESSKEK